MKRAFTLLEVVVAVGIFAVGMVGVIALFTPVAKSVSSTADAEAAARVSDAVRTKLQTMAWDDVAKLLKQSTAANSHELTLNDNRPDYDITRDGQLLFANRDGSKIGLYGDALWTDSSTRRNSDREKFFEIALIRNEDLSPAKPSTAAATDPNPDDTALLLAYTARVRWPAFVADSPTTTVQVGSNPAAAVRFDHSKKQMFFFTGYVRR